MHRITKRSIKYAVEHGHEVRFLCEDCGEDLDPETLVWLELNSRTDEWVEPGTAAWSDTDDSQGCFPFGQACARRVLKTQYCRYANPREPRRARTKTQKRSKA